MTTLPEPDFVMRDPETVLAEVIATYEEEAGAALDPASPEAMFLRTMAYRETLLRIALQDASKLNLLRFSRFPVVDYLGELVGESRRGAEASGTTLRYELDEGAAEDVPVLSGSRVQSKDGRARWVVDEDAVIEAGDTYVDVEATAVEAGAHTNGYTPGQITVLIDPLSVDATVTNLTTSEGGAPAESDARYIERLLLAPDEPGAGSTEAYKLAALSASSAVADAVALNPEPGVARVVVLATTGIPGSELLGLVEAALTPEDARPMCDTVEVAAATEVTWSLHVRLKLYRGADLAETLEAAEQGALAYRDRVQSKLGRDVVQSRISKLVHVAGVYKAIVDEPAADIEVAEDEWAHCDEVLVEFDGWVDGELDDLEEATDA